MDTCSQERALVIVGVSLISFSLTVLQFLRNQAFCFCFFPTHGRVGSDHILLVTGDALVPTAVPERKAVLRQRESPDETR